MDAVTIKDVKELQHYPDFRRHWGRLNTFAKGLRNVCYTRCAFVPKPSIVNLNQRAIGDHYQPKGLTENLPKINENVKALGKAPRRLGAFAMRCVCLSGAARPIGQPLGTLVGTSFSIRGCIG